MLKALLTLTFLLILFSNNSDAETTRDIYKMYNIDIPSDFDLESERLDELREEYNSISHKLHIYNAFDKSVEIYKESYAKTLLNLQSELDVAFTRKESAYKLAISSSELSPSEIAVLDMQYISKSEKYNKALKNLAKVQSQLDKVTFRYKEVDEINKDLTSKQQEVKVQEVKVKTSHKFTEIGSLRNLKPPTTYRPFHITSSYGYRVDPLTGVPSFHNGIDFRSPVGQSVVAQFHGTVIMAEFTELGGNTIIIDHGDGVRTVYLHLHKMLVKVGDKVKQYEKIAESGNTGKWTTGPHLHFSLRLGKNTVNPIYLWR